MIHKYRLNGTNFVLDINSGAVHVVDDLTYDLLDFVEPPLLERCPEAVVEQLCGKYDPAEIRECYDEIVAAQRQGVLFAADTYETYTKFAVASPLKSMCLNVAHDCNMRCTYCFAGTGDFGEGRKLMTAETGKRAIDFLLKESVGREFLEVDFFGGEPLMNFQVVKEIVRYAREKEEECHKKFRFTITTNGLLLDDEKIDFINREFYNVVLSIDGRKTVNDAKRRRLDGSGSYDRILPRYQKLVKSRGDGEYYVRGTYTKDNLDFSEDVFALYDAGFDQISVEPVVAPEEKPYAITEEDLPRIFTEYERLLQRMLELEKTGRKLHFFHFMLDLNAGPCVIKRLRGCGCGNEYVAITPDGDIYPCHQFVGVAAYKMGNLYEGTLNRGMKSDFAKIHVYNKPACKKCWAKFYCSGGCSANNYQYMGDVTRAYPITCAIEKKRVECAVALQAARLKRENEKEDKPL